MPYEACDTVTIPPGSGEGFGNNGRAAEAEGSAPASLQFVEPEPGCRAWENCGWVWAPPEQVASTDSDSVDSLFAPGAENVPALGVAGAAAASLSLLAAGCAGLRRRR